MFDIRPVAHVIGLLTICLGGIMVLPLLVDLAEGNGHWQVFAISAAITIVIGGMITIACENGDDGGLTLQQTFLLTTSVWLVLPLFGALPFVIGATHVGFVDAFFEAMSGLTTTGATVLTGLDDLPKGILLWRGILQWIGGIRYHRCRDGVPAGTARRGDADFPVRSVRDHGKDSAPRDADFIVDFVHLSGADLGLYLGLSGLWARSV